MKNLPPLKGNSTVPPTDVAKEYRCSANITLKSRARLNATTTLKFSLTTITWSFTRSSVNTSNEKVQLPTRQAQVPDSWFNGCFDDDGFAYLGRDIAGRCC